jgi:hypothetical protein
MRGISVLDRPLPFLGALLSRAVPLLTSTCHGAKNLASFKILRFIREFRILVYSWARRILRSSGSMGQTSFNLPTHSQAFNYVACRTFRCFARVFTQMVPGKIRSFARESLRGSGVRLASSC